MRLQLNLITLGVKDLDCALRFYRDGLGWQPTLQSQGDVAFFQMGTAIFSLYPRPLLAEDAHIADDGTGFSGIALACNTASEQEVDDLLKKVEELGATILKPGQKAFWGGYSGYFSDPEGHVWEVAYNPFFERDKDGWVKLE